MMRRAFLCAGLFALNSCAATPARPATAATVESPTFALTLTASEDASTEEPTSIALGIEPRGDHHINLEYPLRIELVAGGGATLAKSTLVAADAREMNAERAHFETEAQWDNAGAHQLSARVLFAVCTPDTCVPREEKLTLQIKVR